jgi:plasmid maintenance system antidote protein VapI
MMRSANLKGVAKVMGVRYSALRGFLYCETALTPDLAERLEYYFGVDRQELLDMQSRYDAQANSPKKE